MQPLPQASDRCQLLLPALDPDPCPLPFGQVKVSAGFPSPAADYEDKRLDNDKFAFLMGGLKGNGIISMGNKIQNKYTDTPVWKQFLDQTRLGNKLKVNYKGVEILFDSNPAADPVREQEQRQRAPVLEPAVSP